MINTINGYIFRIILSSLVFTISGYAIRNTPFSIEGTYFPFNNAVTFKGIIDIKHTLALRICLAHVTFSPDIDINLGMPSITDHPVINSLDIIYSPWQNKLKIQPYFIGGLGFAHRESTDIQRGRLTKSTKIQFVSGIGIDSIFPFLFKKPSVFLEWRWYLGGWQLFTSGFTQIAGPVRWFPELQLKSALGIGMRI